MKLTNIAITTIILSALLLGTFSIQKDIVEDIYGETTTGESVVDYGTISDLEDVSESMEGKVLSISEKAQKFDPTAIYDAAALFIDVGVFLFKIPGALISIIENTMGIMKIPIPGWFSNMIIAIIGVSLTLTIVAIFLKRDEI